MSARTGSSTCGAGGAQTRATSAHGRTIPTPRRPRSSSSSTAWSAPRGEHPDMHVFHYAPHERVEATVAVGQVRHARGRGRRLLRDEVLVDLYAVVRQGLQVGEDELFAQEARAPPRLRAPREARPRGRRIDRRLRGVAETADDELLEAIRAYNEEDCTSTLSLRDWLLDDDASRGRATVRRRLRRSPRTRARGGARTSELDARRPRTDRTADRWAYPPTVTRTISLRPSDA